jgi:histidinol dehydrogenase
MRILRHDQPGFAKDLAQFRRAAEPEKNVEAQVREIIAQVRSQGDEALIELTRRFGGPVLRVDDLRVMERAVTVDAATRRAVSAAHRNVREFARRSLRKNWRMRNREGASVGERFDPFDRVGIYVPGGTAPLVSTAIMTVTLAAAAGVPQIAVTTPPDANGQINDALWHALEVAGATEVYRVGGAQAIAALAFGTKTIAPVQKILGPGNAYVVEAKRQVFGRVAIDLLPGPSEILVIADSSANAAWIAADLLAQAEHGRGSQIVFVTNSKRLLEAVSHEITAQLDTLSRGAHLASVMENDATLIAVRTLEDAVNVANDFAPEHTAVMTRHPETVAAQLRTSGAIFIGDYSPVVAGDFLAGPSHTLPTGGAGKSFGGLSVDMFQRRTSVVRLDAKALRKSLPTLARFSAMEGLDAHGRSAAIRFEPSS